MTLINLNRLLITGPIDVNTPVVTIKEILDSHSISEYDETKFNDEYYMSKLIDIINSKNTRKIQEPYAKSDLRLIARFVNKDETWKCGDLVKAFNFLCIFFDRNNLLIDDLIINLQHQKQQQQKQEQKEQEQKEQEQKEQEQKEQEQKEKQNNNDEKLFNYGLQRMECLYSLNASVLYAICKYNGIITTKTSTIKEMSDNIILFYYLDHPTIKHDVRKYVYEKLLYGCMDRKRLINILLISDEDDEFSMDKDPINFDLSNDFIENTDTSFLDYNNDTSFLDYNNDNTFPTFSDNVSPYNYYVSNNNDNIDYEELLRVSGGIRRYDVRRNPSNKLEAIAMAAIHYKIDLTEIKNPIREYMELTKTPYFPIDIDLTKRLREASIHPESLRNPRLDKIFNPNLPIQLYDYEDLIKMYKEEGCEIDIISYDYDSPYCDLQLSYLLPTFIHGKQGNIINTSTIYDDLEDLEYDEIVIFGVRGEEFIAYTYAELSEAFKYYKRFENPQRKGEIFQTSCIDKLYFLSKENQRYRESKEMFNERMELVKNIDFVRAYQETDKETIREFVDIYSSLRSDDQREVEYLITLLLESSMYMRGWKGKGPYPIKSEDTIVKPDEQNLVDIRVTESIIKLEQGIKNVNDKNGGVGDLFFSLPLMMYERQKLIPSSNDDEGLTIKDRIEIVKGGVDVSMESCMRLSSNRFCSTAYYYMKLLDMKLSFNIEDLSNIS